MAYIPKNQYQVLYTNGNEFRLDSTRKPYKGKYLKLQNGKLFAGESPDNILGKLIPLSSFKESNIVANRNNRIYSNLRPDIASRQGKYIPVPSHTPSPTPFDYSRGYFKRYILIRLNTQNYMEISMDTFSNFAKRNYNKLNHTVFLVEWALGENNELENTRNLRKLEPSYPGIFNFFPDKSQYNINNLENSGSEENNTGGSGY